MSFEKRLIHQIQTLTEKRNRDNISRTDAYLQFYKLHPEIKWSFLAHMVSRNAGWNMCDLESPVLKQFMNKEKRMQFFLTYEKANWLIFQDAYPQLLLYHYSTINRVPLFHLLKYFHVSCFMRGEWENFWQTNDKERLLFAQIINEQNLIEQPVIKKFDIRKNVFYSFLFLFQEAFHFQAVLLPTIKGELYGVSVNHFRNVDHRIELGKRISQILFHRNLHRKFYQFAQKTIHTGSRYDYEQYLTYQPIRSTPFLRTTYPIIQHKKERIKDWSQGTRIKDAWFTKEIKKYHPLQITEWYLKKEKLLKKLNAWIN